MVSCSQVRLMSLTARKHDVGLQLSKLSNEKVSLQRDMRKLSLEYRQSASAKTLMWSNNAGVSYIPLTYSNLMTPSDMNQQNPCLLTDLSGAVVISDNYKKYAEMISKNGGAGGDYESNRTKILVELTGIDPNKFDMYDVYKKDKDSAQDTLDTLYLYKENNIDRLKKKFTNSGNMQGLLEKIGSTTGGGSFKNSSDWKSAYGYGDTIKFSSSSDLNGIGNQLKKLAPYFVEIPKEDFEKAVDNTLMGSITAVENGNELPEGGIVTGSKNKGYEIDVVALVNQVLSAAGAERAEDKGYTGSNRVNYVWYDTSSSYYSQWKSEYDKWEIDIEAAKKVFQDAESNLSAVFTSSEEREIDFYDKLFSAIADKGWTFNDKVTENAYLNDMLQNGLYSLTTMERSVYTDGKNTDGTAKFQYNYTSDIAVNNNHVYPVNDTDFQNEALVDYEYKKSIIDEKETRIDTRMKNLQTEQSAIQQMIQGLESVRNENIDRTFSIFT